MARETKIGLVVGMGFIICFAIILSHRGKPAARDDALPIELADAADDSAATIQSHTAEQAARDIGRHDELTRSAHSRTARLPSTPPGAGRNRDRGLDAAPGRQELGHRGGTSSSAVGNLIAPRPDPLAQSESDPNRFTNRGEPIPVGPPASIVQHVEARTHPPHNETEHEATVPEGPVPETDREPLVVHLPPAAEATAENERLLKNTTLAAQLQTADEVLDAVAAGGLPRTIQAREPATQHEDAESNDRAQSQELRSANSRGGMLPPTVGRQGGAQAAVVDASQAGDTRHVEYTIQPGDMLSRIAKEHYGTAGPAILDAICKANPKAIADTDHIVVGRTIVLPNLGVTAPPAAVTDDRTEPKRAAAPPRAEIPTGLAYEIRPGDTLGKIAKSFYGTSAHTVVDAICAANPDAIADPNVVVVGRKIVLPSVDGVGSPQVEPETRLSASQALSTQTERALEPEQQRRPAAPKSNDRRLRQGDGDFKWYQLKAGDVYTTVAADVFGTSKRWRELAELNKDIFPDPSRIRSGVNIRIPATSVQRRSRSSGGL